MRHQDSGTRIDSGRSWSWTLLLGVVLALGVVFPAGSMASGGAASGPDVGRGGGDDETIGTLPILGNQGQTLELVRRARDVRPDFYLEGAYDEILSTIVGFTGTGRVSFETLPSGHVRLGFHGQLEVELDRGLLHATGLQIGARVPAAYRGARASGGLAGQAGPLFRMRTGDLALPVTALDGAGALDPTPWVLNANSRTCGGYQFHALADGSILYIGQSY